MLSSMLLALTLSAPQADWRLHYERSGFLETGRYAEAVEFCERLDRASPHARVVRFGTSPQGRPMVALAISKERAFTPEAARRSQKPLVFVLNGIHSGEIEGKDASLILARELLIEKKHPEILDGVNLLIVPVFGLDAHERFSAYNRINQNGPTEMGWRSSAQNLNLNRDFTKADAGEMRAMLPLMNNWKPDLYFDNHTTNGGDWQYVVMLAIPVAQTLDPSLAAWSRELYNQLESEVSRDGYPVSPYFSLTDEKDPSKGISVGDFSPRYSIGYWAAMNRPSILVETHMLKPYKQRVEGTYWTMVRTMQKVAREAEKLKAMNRAADEIERVSREGSAIVLTAETSDATRAYTFKGYPYTPRQSDVSGGEIRNWDRTKPTDFPSTVRDQYRAGMTVALPAAYAVPPQWKDVITVLDLHGIEGKALKAPLDEELDMIRFTEVAFARTPFESRFLPSFKVEKFRARRTLPAGTMIYNVSQVGAKRLAHLLEAEAPDSLLKWGSFNLIFESKEYAEDYAMEPIARQMLNSDPKLKAEFEERLKDPEFAKSPRARLQFFYERSPFYDEELNVYPVVRLTTDQLARART